MLQVTWPARQNPGPGPEPPTRPPDTCARPPPPPQRKGQPALVSLRVWKLWIHAGAHEQGRPGRCWSRVTEEQTEPAVCGAWLQGPGPQARGPQLATHRGCRETGVQGDGGAGRRGCREMGCRKTEYREFRCRVTGFQGDRDAGRRV